MKMLFRFLFIPILIFGTILSCGSDDEIAIAPEIDNIDQTDDDIEDNPNASSTAIQVMLPNDSELDLTTTTSICFYLKFF